MYAIVLAGGKGERLRPFTEDRPKAMVEIVGIPILSYQLQWLQAQGVTDLIIASGYRHEVIESYFGDGERLGLRISHAIEQAPLGRGGALRAALGQVPAKEDVVIATNGDVITNIPLAPLLSAHRAGRVLATIMLTPFVSPYGIVEIDNEDRVTQFREKPELPYWINGGVYALSPAIRDLLPERGDHETTTFPELARDGRLGAFRTRGYWRGVDTIKDVNEVAAEFQGRLLSLFRER
ncbi:MAG TPA: nucleotidyltransferase family protein [bacterium]|nr:nucleotidyltransferase family protein [bacterium]